MAPLIPAVTVIEDCRVAPPGGTAPELLSLPLTFFDARWLNFHPMPNVFFYEFSHKPKSYFMEIIIPKLKESLSIALKHFFPLAGSLILPAGDSGKVPEIRFVAGDSVPLTVAESCDDFNYLAANYPRYADRFYPLLPKIEVGSRRDTITPLFALQVTIFPNCGISISFSQLHVLCDASSIIGFLKAWASINKFSGDAQMRSSLVPSHDRSKVKDPYNLLAKVLREKNKGSPWEFLPQPNMFSVEKLVRATYILSPTDVQKLKNSVFEKSTIDKRNHHVSSFTVTCAYVWICWLKSMDKTGERIIDENYPEYFVVAANFRARFDPPLPPNYFGNCVVPCIAGSKHGELVGSEGLSIAAASIGEAIRRRVHNREGIMNGSYISEMKAPERHRTFSVGGSPKFNTYDADFGWGKPKKYESISTDLDRNMSLQPSSQSEGALEVGLSLFEKEMDAFATIFSSGLSIFSLRSKV